jgi:hypothetical protein
MRKTVIVLLLASFLLLTNSFQHIFTKSRHQISPRNYLSVLSRLYAKPPPQPEDAKGEKKGGLTIGGLVQLVLMGAGAPGLGEYKGTDPTTGKMMFELEANNFINAKGEDLQTKGKFFKDGWVEGSTDALDKPPGFFANLLSGGKLQEEWDARNRKSI